MSVENITLWSCPRCGFRVQKPSGDFAAVFHPCYPPRSRRRRRVRLPEVEMSREEYLSDVYQAFADAVPEEATLRRVE